MKLYQKIKLFGKGLRTGLLFVCLLSALCALTGCGQEDGLLSELQREPPASLGEDFDETGVGDPETVQGNAGMEGSQNAGQAAAERGAQSAGQDTDAKGSQSAGQYTDTKGSQSVGQGTSEREAPGYGQDAAVEAGQGAGQNNGVPGAENQSGAEIIYVHVCGEVKAPGVYELPAESRFYEAVEAAGGFTEDACRDYLNMAAPLADGSRLEIPSAEAVAGRKEREGSSENGGTDMENEYSYYTCCGSGDPAPEQAGSGNADASDGLVNINTADVARLCTLPGVGEARAKAIIEYREKQGGFQKKEDIMQVSGIGEKMYARMEVYLTVE